MILERKKHSQLVKDIYRSYAYFLAPFVSKSGINANFITFIRLPFIVAACILISLDYLSLSNKIIASFFIFFFSFFDALDGEVAQLTKKTFIGKWMDPQIDRLGLTSIFLALFFGLRESEEQNTLMFFLITGCCLWWITNNNISDFQYKPKYINSLKNQVIDHNKSLSKLLIENKNTKKGLGIFLYKIIIILKWFNLNTFLHLHNICILLIGSLLLGRLDIFVYSFFIRALMSYIQIIFIQIKKVKAIDYINE